MIGLEPSWVGVYETPARGNFRYFGLAIGLHVALLLWNPILLRSSWHRLTSIGDGDVILVDLPGPVSTTLPGMPDIHRSHPSRPTLQPTVTPPGLEAITKRLPELVKSPVSSVATPPLVSRTFHTTRLPVLPATGDIEFAPSPTPGPITLGPSLIPRTDVAPTLPLADYGVRHGPAGGLVNLPMLSGDGVSGRVLIQFKTPTPIPLEVQTTPTSARPASENTSIEGPLANRTIAHRVVPEYPAWAEEQGVMGTVRLYFTVSQDGNVRPNIRIHQTSGHVEFDTLAVEALRQWQFASLGTDQNQWGIITFQFSLVR